jgi:hypothetical protein
VAVLVDVLKYKSRPPGRCDAHLRMMAMAVALRGGVTTMDGQGRVSWRIQEYKRQRRQCNNQPANKRQVKEKV